MQSVARPLTYLFRNISGRMAANYIRTAREDDTHWTYLLFRRRLYPRCHLILLIIASCQASMIWLSTLVVEKEVDRKLGCELSRFLDLLNLFSSELDRYCVGHRFDMFDGVHSDDGEYICRL